MTKVRKINIEEIQDEELKMQLADYERRDILKGNYAEALRIAAEKGHIEVCEILLDYGADIHFNNDEAIRYASENGMVEVVEFLIMHGANIHTNYDYPIRYAAENGHLDVVKLLYENHAQIITAKHNAVFHAALNGHIHILNYFFEKNKNLKKYCEKISIELAEMQKHKYAIIVLGYIENAQDI